VTYIDPSASPNNTYSYRVRAANSGGYSAYTATASVVTLGAPTNLAAQVQSTTSIKLTWLDKSTAESGFKIERKIGAGAFVEIASVGGGIVTYTNTGPQRGHDLHLPGARAFAANSFSSYSNTSSGTP